MIINSNSSYSGEGSMLRDFWLLETYFGETDAAQDVEDVLRRYGVEPVKKALQAGHLKIHTVFVQPGPGRAFCCLSEGGRRAAQGRNPDDQPV